MDIESRKPSVSHSLVISTNIGQTPTKYEWMNRLNEIHDSALKNKKTSFRKTVGWWARILEAKPYCYISWKSWSGWSCLADGTELPTVQISDGM